MEIEGWRWGLLFGRRRNGFLLIIRGKGKAVFINA